MRVHQHLAEFREESSFTTWLHRITARVAIDVLRKERPCRRSDVADVPEPVLRDAAPGVLSTALGTDPQETVLRRELSARLTEALGELPDLHRTILVLREMDGLSYEELAERLGIPKGTVMSRLFHARKKMQALLAGYAGIDAPGAGEPPREVRRRRPAARLPAGRARPHRGGAARRTPRDLPGLPGAPRRHRGPLRTGPGRAPRRGGAARLLRLRRRGHGPHPRLGLARRSGGSARAAAGLPAPPPRAGGGLGARARAGRARPLPVHWPTGVEPALRSCPSRSPRRTWRRSCSTRATARSSWWARVPRGPDGGRMRSIWTAAWVAVAVLVCLPALGGRRAGAGAHPGAPGLPPGRARCCPPASRTCAASSPRRPTSAGSRPARCRRRCCRARPSRCRSPREGSVSVKLVEARQRGGHLRGERPGVADPVPGHRAAGEAHRAAGLRRAGRERLVRHHQGGRVAGRAPSGGGSARRRIHHHRDQPLEAGGRLPPELAPRLRRVGEEPGGLARGA